VFNGNINTGLNMAARTDLLDDNSEASRASAKAPSKLVHKQPSGFVLGSCATRSVMITTLHQIVLWRWNEGGWDWPCMSRQKCVQGFGWTT
jgi:hypothetical protein